MIKKGGIIKKRKPERIAANFPFRSLKPSNNYFVRVKP